MDFMNLHQSAHGDREFAFIQTRLRRGRKTVVGHWEDPRGRGATRVRGRGPPPDGTSRTAQDRPVRRQHARGRGHRGRQGRGAGPARVLGQRLRRDGARRARSGGRRRRGGPARRRLRDDYDVAPALRPGGDRHAELRTAARIEGGLRSFLDDGGFGAFTDTFEDLGALAQLPGIGVQRLMADGYGFGAEGDWKAAALVRILKVMGDGLPGGTSFMEDYTYHLGDPVPGGARRAHARGLPVDRRRPARRARSTRCRSAAARTRCGWCSTPRPGRPSSSASPTSATASGSSPTRSTSSSPTRRCRGCPSPARSGGRGPTWRPPPRPG